MENKKKMKARFQLSYNIRLAIQAIWIVAAFLLRDKVHFIAAAAPIFFPKFTILYLQFSGKLMPPNAPKAETEASGDASTEA